jgi:hypothetical protein
MSAIAITFADLPGGPPRQHRLAGQLLARCPRSSALHACLNPSRPHDAPASARRSGASLTELMNKSRCAVSARCKRPWSRGGRRDDCL